MTQADAIAIEQLQRPVSDADLNELAALLADAVDSGSAVSFLAPLPRERAIEWWRGVLEGADERAAFLVARDGNGIVGTVQMHPAWPPNQPHRADIAKLIVHRRARGRGIGARLMEAVESAARAAGFTLLTLDTKRGDTAERLYRRLGWTEVGVIPNYAVDPDGRTPHDTVVFYREIG